MSWLNWPNRITATRIVLIVPLVICLLNINTGPQGWRYAAIILFVVMGISDVLDGFLARLLRAETAIGRFLDPVGDKLLVASALILLSIEATAIPGYRLPSWVPVVAIGKDVLIVIGFALVYAMLGEWFIRPRLLGKACTVVQLLLIGYCLVAPDLPQPWTRLLPAIYWTASGLAVIALADYITVGSRFTTQRSSRPEGDSTP